MRRSFLATPLFALSLAACDPAVEDSSLQIQKSGVGDGILATLRNEEGDSFTLSCDADGTPSIILVLAEAAKTPPPLRGVFGAFQVDGGENRRVELAWFTESSWGVRDEEPADEAKAVAVVQDVLSGEELVFGPPAEYAQSEPIKWGLEALRGNDEVIRLCAVRA